MAAKRQEEPCREGILSFIVENSSERVIVFDHKLGWAPLNRRARTFLQRSTLPAEVTAIAKRILDAMAVDQVAVRFSDRVVFSKEVGGRMLTFRFAFRAVPDPQVIVYVTDETVSSRFNMNAIRDRFRISRREVDVLRHLLDGADNREISEELGIVTQTVKEHVSHIYAKIGVSDRFSLLRRLMSAALGP